MPSVCLFVCLSVCLPTCQQLCLTPTERIFMKILTQMTLWTKKNWLNYETHQPSDPDPGIFGGFSNIAKYGIFPQFGSHFRENDLGYLWNFYYRFIYIQARKSPLNFGSNPNWILSPDSDSVSGPDSPWRSALV